jgi:hypothetical protein
MAMAAAFDRSMILPATKGPRSLMRTTTLLPSARLVTVTKVPKGSFLWAAVMARMSNDSPLAVFLP